MVGLDMPQLKMESSEVWLLPACEQTTLQDTCVEGDPLNCEDPEFLCSCWLCCVRTTWQTLVLPLLTQPGHLVSLAPVVDGQPGRACTSTIQL